MSKSSSNSTKCKKCGKFAQIPDHTLLCIECYYNPQTTREQKINPEWEAQFNNV
jgi:hypothetical protein